MGVIDGCHWGRLYLIQQFHVSLFQLCCSTLHSGMKADLEQSAKEFECWRMFWGFGAIVFFGLWCLQRQLSLDCRVKKTNFSPGCAGHGSVACSQGLRETRETFLHFLKTVRQVVGAAQSFVNCLGACLAFSFSSQLSDFHL